MLETDKIEVRARSMNAVVRSVGMFRPLIESIGHSLNIFSVDPDGWMPRETGLKSFAMFEKIFGSHVLYKIGTSVAKNMALIESVKDIEGAAANLDKVYHLNHRLNGKIMYDVVTGEMLEGIGHYSVENISRNEFLVNVLSPYPCDFDTGIIEEYFKKYAGGKEVVVLHKPGSLCKKNGDKTCQYSLNIVDFDDK